MSEIRKVTAFLPAKLLADAQVIAGAGVTETLRAALEAFNRAAWYRKMLELEGKVAIDIDLDALREDREFDEHGAVIN
ncbi:MAG: hypothetical protein JWO83_5045 [Caulobacteraceae bacterium]|jgi:hypothetical protein|nr:hypothetical protein [Caulobacteraceae bacterium]